MPGSGSGRSPERGPGLLWGTGPPAEVTAEEFPPSAGIALRADSAQLEGAFSGRGGVWDSPGLGGSSSGGGVFPGRHDCGWMALDLNPIERLGTEMTRRGFVFFYFFAWMDTNSHRNTLKSWRTQSKPGRVFPIPALIPRSHQLSSGSIPQSGALTLNAAVSVRGLQLSVFISASTS